MCIEILLMRTENGLVFEMADRGRPPKAEDEKFVRVTLTLPPALLKRARKQARPEDGGLSGLVAQALETLLRGGSGNRGKTP
ncbi:MAG: hypothetical protein ACI9R3_005952 [Verrucomicrobiales bacterium]